MDDVERAKRRAAKCAAETIEDGQVVGLGSGSTAAYAIEALGTRVDIGLDIVGVPTSFQSRSVAREVGVSILELEDAERVDVTIDGADQVTSHALLKGGGGAHAREKLLATASDELVIVVDERKETDVIDEPVPLEVLHDARSIVARHVRDLGGEPTLRTAAEKSGPVVTDNGNLLIDCDFGEIEEPAHLSESLDELAGVVEHGMFVGLADVVYVGDDEGVTVR